MFLHCYCCVSAGRGVQLVEREQELCVFYERLNKLNGAMQEDNKKIEVMEDEIKKLKILQKEQDRQINLQRQQLSCIRALQEESTLLQIQVTSTL